MTEQWQELKETIIEMRDNNGTGTQQEVCKFLANLMEVLEKQMQEPTDDYFRKKAGVVISQLRADRDRLEDELAKREQESSGDLISRQAALDAFGLSEKTRKYGGDHSGYDTMMKYEIQDVLEDLPPVNPQEPCDKYIKEIDHLRKYISKLETQIVEQEPKTGHWIPVSERLPNDRDWYLGIFKEPDTGWINPLPFICDYVGSETKATTKEHWILRGFTDMDERIGYYFNLECVAWMPLPEPYKTESEEKK